MKHVGADRAGITYFNKNEVEREKDFCFWGWGVLGGATATNGDVPPDARQLAKLIADRFLGGRFSTSSLNQVSEYAIGESSLVDVQEG